MEDTYFVSYYGGFPGELANIQDAAIEWDGHDLNTLKEKVKTHYYNTINIADYCEEDLTVSIINFKKLKDALPNPFSDGGISVKRFLEIVDYKNTFKNITVADAEGNEDLPTDKLVINGEINKDLYLWHDFYSHSVDNFSGNILYIDRGKPVE